jgi:hypothetical protein
MNEQEELASLQLLWKTPTESRPSLDVSALLHSVQRKQRALFWWQIAEWTLFALGIAAIIWLTQRPNLTAPLVFFIAFNAVVLPWFQWRLHRTRRMAKLALTDATDAASLLARAKKQTESELAHAELNVRASQWLSLGGLIYLPWLIWTDPSTWAYRGTVTTVLWFASMGLCFWFYRRKRHRELERLRWIDAQNQDY